MLRPTGSMDHNGMPTPQSGTSPITSTTPGSNPSGSTYFSHGPYGPNGLYRAHGERQSGPGFSPGPARTGITGRVFGDSVHTPNALPTINAQANSPLNAGFGAQTGSKPNLPVPSTVSGGADLSRWGGIRKGAHANAAQQDVRTPELQLLIVDDDEAVRGTCSEMASGMGFNVIGVPDVIAARNILRHQTIDLLLLDLKLPGSGEAMSLVEEVRTTNPQTAVVVMTAHASVDSAVEAIRIGAGDYLTKPFVLSDLTSVLERVGSSRLFDIESRLLRERLRTPNGMGDIIGRSPEMEKLYRILSKVAHSTHPVLILGESGTGKELVARSIHENGPNAAKPFIPVDCGALVSTLMESELFGYVKGAFTGANKTKEGLLSAADGGTVFLDEIGEIPLDMQAKLLRALQEKEVRPVGATHAVPISARVLAATNRDLASMVEQGRFRKDLFFRLNVVNLRIPPLRDRRNDIPVLAMHFLEKQQKEKKMNFEFTNEAFWTMTQYDWPGNVRELENAVEHACAMSSGPILQIVDLPTQLQDSYKHGQKKNAEALEASRVQPHTPIRRDPPPEEIVSIAQMERNAILDTIRQLDGDKLLAAKLLGIGKTTLYRKLKEYGLEVDAEFGN